MRPADWMQRLDRVLESWRTRPFVWGQSDCVHFALDVLQAVSAKNWQGVELPAYETAVGAYRVLCRLRFHSLEEAVTAFLGASIAPERAQRGDLVTLPTPQGLALGVCTGLYAAAPGPHGLVFCKLHSIQHCWRT